MSNLELIRTNFLAGSRLLKTNTYQSTIEGFMEHKKVNEEEAKLKIIEGVNLCHQAIKIFQQDNASEGN